MRLTPGEKLGSYSIGALRWSDPFAEIYTAESADGSPAIIKVSDDPFPLVSESAILAGLNADADPRFVPFIPSMLAALPDGSIQGLFSGESDWYTLREVNEEHGPLDPRDMAWMYRRILMALSFTHNMGYFHCGLVPESVLIQPEKHGLILTGWYLASMVDEDDDHYYGNLGDPWPGYANWYPHDTFASSGLDLFLATNLARWLIGGDPADPGAPIPNVPAEYNKLFAGATKPLINDRFSDAAKVLDFFNTLLERLYGRREFRPFEMTPRGSDA